MTQTFGYGRVLTYVSRSPRLMESSLLNPHGTYFVKEVIYVHGRNGFDRIGYQRRCHFLFGELRGGLS